MRYIVCTPSSSRARIHREDCGQYTSSWVTKNWSDFFDTKEEAEAYMRSFPNKTDTGDCQRCLP